MRTLVVDDDFVSRSQVKALLSTFGDCDGVPDGTVGLELFKAAHREQTPYDLVVLDVEMPGISGQEVLRAIRRWEVETDNYRQGREVKVLMLSALSDGRNVMESFQAGCEAYVVKPLTKEKLHQALAEVGFRG